MWKYQKLINIILEEVDKQISLRKSICNNSDVIRMNYEKYKYGHKDIKDLLINMKNKIVNFKEYLLSEDPIINDMLDDEFKKLNPKFLSKNPQSDNFLEKFHVNGMLINVYLNKNNNQCEYQFYNSGYNILGVYIIEDHKKYIIEKLIWQNKNYKGIMYDIYIKWVLKKFKFIITDYQFSQLGVRFFQKIYEYCIRKHYQVGVLNIETMKNIVKFDSVESFELGYYNFIGRTLDKNRIIQRFYIKQK